MSRHVYAGLTFLYAATALSTSDISISTIPLQLRHPQIRFTSTIDQVAGNTYLDADVARRVQHLLDNQELAAIPLSDGKKSNCFGTTAYVLDIRLPGDTTTTTRATFASAGRPQYMPVENMRTYLRSQETGTAVPGNILALYWTNNKSDEVADPGFALRHMAVCVGSKNGEPLLFHQYGTGRHFEIFKLSDLVKRNLSDDMKQTLTVEWFKPRQ